MRRLLLFLVNCRLVDCSDSLEYSVCLSVCLSAFVVSPAGSPLRLVAAEVAVLDIPHALGCCWFVAQGQGVYVVVGEYRVYGFIVVVLFELHE